jgi:hypothetical protein
MSREKKIVVYSGYRVLFEKLSNEEQGRLLMAMLNYAEYGEVPDFGGALKIAFGLIRHRMDQDAERDEKRRQTNRKNGKKGGRPRKEKGTDSRVQEPKITNRFSDITDETEMRHGGDNMDVETPQREEKRIELQKGDWGAGISLWVNRFQKV